MADIDIEKKKPVWPWILLAVAVVIVLLIIFIDDEDEAEVVTDEPIENTIGSDRDEGLIAAEEDIAAVEDFVMFVNENEESMGLEHNYTHDGLILLIDAIEAMADEINYNVEADISEAREVANFITEEPFTGEHANRLTRGFRVLTNALTAMQQAHYPALSDDVTFMDEEVTKLEEIASSLNPDELTLEQKEIVNSFFNRAAEILNEMN